MTTFAAERFEEAYPEAGELIRMNYAETEKQKQEPLDVNTEAYKAIEAAGMLQVYTAREDGELVGYAMFLMSRGLHQSGCIHATQDVLYIHPKVRGTTVGYRFTRWIDEQLKAAGADLVTQYVKQGHPALGRVLEKLGYQATDTVYQRRL